MFTPKKGDMVVFSNAPREQLRTVVFEIDKLDDDILTVRLVDEPVLCDSKEPHEHVHTMSLTTAEQLGMRLA